MPHSAVILVTLLFSIIGQSVYAVVRCPHPNSDVNTKVVTESLDAGATATYSCDRGYELFGDAVRTCGANGEWSGRVPICATNVAWRKPVNQSSTARGGKGENANDGDRSSLHDGNKCTQTNVDDSPWWSVDLLQEYEIISVRITTRSCCGLEELQDLEIRVGDSENLQRNRLCAWYPGTIELGATKELECARPMRGRYVFVQMVGKVGALSLCEVEVFSREEISKDRCRGDFDVNKLGLFNQTCYEFQISSGGTFEVAKNYCEKRREGSLVQGIVPLTRTFLLSELERLEPEMQTKMLWIGVQKEPQFISRVWRWIDGSKVNKPTWGREQPNNYNGEQNCVVLDGSRSWMWNDVGCNLNYLFWVCQFKPSCGSPNKNLNTTLQILPTVNDTIAVYSCPEGNKVEGDTHRTCTVDGFWSGSAPTCKYINCAAPKSIDNGIVSLMDLRTTYSARAMYVCAENYTMAGNQTLKCEENGKWSPKAPKCLYSWCSEIESPQNGNLVLSGRKSGDTANFKCDPGYYLLGKETLSCELGGTWSGKAPACRFVDCGVPENLENGKMTLINSTTFVGSNAVYKCDEDFWIDGPEDRICESNGYWSGEKPKCQKTDCGEPRIPIGGYVTGYSFEVHSEVEYHCEDGHYMTGESVSTCGINAKWSGETPNCTYVDCGRVAPLMKGEIIHLNTNEPTYLGAEINYKCMPNYRIIGAASRKCLRNGKWSRETPKCEEIRCDEPEHPEKSRVTISGNDRRIALARPRSAQQSQSSHKVGSQVTYRCERGNVVAGDNIRTCLKNGTWSSSTPKCSFVDCGAPSAINRGVFRLLSNETSYGAVVSYECEANWKVDGKIRRYCQENSTWSGPTPACIEVLCPSLHEDLMNRYKSEDAREIEPWNTDLIEARKEKSKVRVQVKDGDRRVGSSSEYYCIEGQKLVGDKERICKQHGVWEGKEPKCEWIYCEKPKNIPNGRVHITNEELVYGSVVEYFCLPKFFLNGPFNRTCAAEGSWSGSEPICSVNDMNLSIFGDNTVDGTSNAARGSMDGTLTGASYTGIYVGVAVSLILALAVGLALLFFKTRENKLTKPPTTNGVTKSVDGHHPAVMTYGDLNDPTTGNNIYEHIPDDLGSHYSTPDDGYDHTYTNTRDGPTYANDKISNGSSVPLHISQRPRMPPPQPPTVPSTFKPSTAVTGVTVNGVSVNTG